MAFIAVIQRGPHIIPITIGGSGPDAECLQTWDDRQTAIEESGEVLLAKVFSVLIIDLDDADVA